MVKYLSIARPGECNTVNTDLFGIQTHNKTKRHFSRHLLLTGSHYTVIRFKWFHTERQCLGIKACSCTALFPLPAAVLRFVQPPRLCRLQVCRGERRQPAAQLLPDRRRPLQPERCRAQRRERELQSVATCRSCEQIAGCRHGIFSTPGNLISHS